MNGKYLLFPIFKLLLMFGLLQPWKAENFGNGPRARG